ncbi:calcium-binding protein [Sphingomonas sp.]|uniref:calcium-binding protein n=1 Tax=Sphingomonas sp. TaxID=28214 RepID=UPI00286DFFB7|nr:calcium-binding protein [Sphingomonas sp.]
MHKLLIGGAAAAALLALAPALAQTPAPAAAAPHAHHGMMMKTHSRTDVAAHVQTMFARVDGNRDGAITKAEAEAVRGMRHDKRAERRSERRGERHAQAFDRIDTNRDGSIARAEWDAHAAQRQQRMGMRHEGEGKRGGMRGMGMGGLGGRMFEMADANRDARVTLAEATTAALSHFDMADTNRDGQLTPDERKAMHQRMRGMKHSG